jgi:hypothetical protein
MLALFVVAGMAGCGDDSTPYPESDAGADGDSGGTPDAGPPADGGRGVARTLRHTFDPVHVEPGEELSWLCQSWTVGNETPLFVHEVRMVNDGAWHHSNWFFVPEDQFDGPDGTWDCDDRTFSEVGAGVVGGVLFAQSTQVMQEAQTFPPGTAFVIPPRARILGDIHLINLGREAVDSAITFEIDTVPESEVEVPLVPMTMTNRALALPPRQASRFTMHCDFGELLGAPFDFRFYYVLPHHHALGSSFHLEATGGPGGDETVVEVATTVGEPWGVSLAPAVDVTGATGLRMTCGYDNPRDVPVQYGLGDQEMCVMLGFTDANFKLAGGSNGDSTAVAATDGIDTFEAPCQELGFPAG